MHRSLNDIWGFRHVTISSTDIFSSCQCGCQVYQSSSVLLYAAHHIRFRRTYIFYDNCNESYMTGFARLEVYVCSIKQLTFNVQ